MATLNVIRRWALRARSVRGEISRMDITDLSESDFG